MTTFTQMTKRLLFVLLLASSIMIYGCKNAAKKDTADASADSGIVSSGSCCSDPDPALYRSDASGNPVQGWYTDTDGARGYCCEHGYLMTGFQMIDGSRYLFTKDGIMVTGEYTAKDGSRCLFAPDGQQYINCIGEVNGEKHFYDAQGNMVYGRFSFPDGHTGIADTEGRVLTGSHLIGTEVFSFTTGGKLRHTVDATRPMVALTYDDGPSPLNTPMILETLKACNAYATFFVVGYNARDYPDVLRQIYDSGSEIANHTFDHVNLCSIDDSQIRAQITSDSDAVEQATGNRPQLLRPPGGNTNDALQQTAAATDSGYPLIMWSIDTLDWQHRSPDATCNAIRSAVYDGSIILMHDIWPETVTASQIIIPELVSMGYQLVTVSELAAARGGMVPGSSYRDFDPSLTSEPLEIPDASFKPEPIETDTAESRTVPDAEGGKDTRDTETAEPAENTANPESTADNEGTAPENSTDSEGTAAPEESLPIIFPI